MSHSRDNRTLSYGTETFGRGPYDNLGYLTRVARRSLVTYEILDFVRSIFLSAAKGGEPFGSGTFVLSLIRVLILFVFSLLDFPICAFT